MATSPTQMGDYLKQLFLKGQGAITQSPGPAAPSTRRFYKTHQGYDVGVPAGTPITPSFSGTVLGTYQDRTGFGQRQLVRNEATGESYYLSHLSKPIVKSGKFQAGQPISYTGGVPGTYGAGQTTGPHLDITAAGKNAYATILNNIRRLAPPISKAKINLADIFTQAREKYGKGIKAVSTNQKKLSDIAGKYGGRVIKL